MAALAVGIVGMIELDVLPALCIVTVGALPWPVTARGDMAACAVIRIGVVEGRVRPICRVVAV